MNDIGIAGQMIVDGRDISPLLSSFRRTMTMAAVDNTRMRNHQNRFRTFTPGLYGGSWGFTGDLPDDQGEALIHLEDFLKRDDVPRLIFQAPFGADVGKLARFGQAIRTSTEMSDEIEGVLSLNAEFEVTAGSPGALSGLTLFSPNLSGNTLSQDEISSLVFTNADPNQFFAVRAVGTSQIFQFQAGTVTNSSLAAGIQGLPAYAGRTVTVTGSALAGTTSKSGAKQIEWDGSVDVPALEILQGELHVLQLNNATTAKTIYGNITVDPTASSGAGTDAATLQTAVRGKGGAFAQVTVTKTGTGGNASYTFAYPIGANPADLVQPTGKANLVVTTPVANGTLYSDGLILNPQNAFDKNSSTVTTLQAGAPATGSVGWVFNTSLVINAIRVTSDTMGDLRLYGSTNGIFSGPTYPSDPIVGSFSSGRSQAQLVSGAITPFANTTAYRAYVLVNDGASDIPIKEIEFMGDGPDAEVTVSNYSGGYAQSLGLVQVQQGGTFQSANVVSTVTSGPTVQDIPATQTSSAGMMVALQSVLNIMGTSTWKIQHAPNNNGSPGTWVDLLTFDDVSGSGAQVKEVAVGTTIYPFLRARCSAITGSAQVAIGAARRY
jgi:hypothetical protein